MQNKDTVTVLNELIQISEDGKKGYAEAATEATSSELKTLFKRQSSECGAAATELQKLVSSLGGLPKDSGTIAGAAHRGWTKLKSAIRDANISVLEEVERAEDSAKDAYSKALGTSLPQQVRAVIQRQYEGVVRNHDNARALRNRYKAEKEAIAE